MSINRVKTTGGEQSFNFLTNQSSILHTVDTNKITINGVNVIVDKPKRGDIMCITKYRKENGDLLEADKQKVIWIDGLSIEPTQLSQELEPVGICLIVKGNKAIVRYREEKILNWSTIFMRFELPESSIMNDGVEHTCRITLDFGVKPNPFVFTASSRAEFVEQLNIWFLANDPSCSAELLELDTDLPAVDTSDTKDGDSYRNRVIVNSSGFDLEITGIGGILVPPKQVKYSEGFFYLNNGFIRDGWAGGCCRAKYYDQIQDLESFTAAELIEPMTSIDTGETAVTLNDFTDNEYCQILRDNFANYDEYFDSMMTKYPCGIGDIAVFSCGKEDTYKLADCTYFDNTTGKQEVLYPAANWAASISLNAPKLGKGNWWLPSVTEITEIMRDITYGTTLWATKPDIINCVLAKLTSIDNSSWSMLDTNVRRCTSSVYSEFFFPYICLEGYLNNDIGTEGYIVSPITIYEF